MIDLRSVRGLVVRAVARKCLASVRADSIPGDALGGVKVRIALRTAAAIMQEELMATLLHKRGTA